MKNLSLLRFIVLTLSTMFISLNTNGYSFRHTDLESFSNEETTFQFLNGTNYLVQDGDQCLNRSKSDNLCKFETSEKNKKIYVIGDSMISSLVSGFLNDSIANDYTIIESKKSWNHEKLYNKTRECRNMLQWIGYDSVRISPDFECDNCQKLCHMHKILRYFTACCKGCKKKLWGLTD